LNKPQARPPASFGFISVREIEDVGYCGGLLIVSHLGRPLEFHCSVPIQPNRAQQILYGQTYPTYLFCEQIGLALIDKAKSTPNLFLANSKHLLALNAMVSVPVVALRNDAEPLPINEEVQLISLGPQQVWYPSHAFEEMELNHQRIVELLNQFSKSLTLDEPFERIEKAIEEAQAVAR
jgi:hypothetical protein